MNSAMSSASSATRESVAEDSSDYQLDAPRVAPTEINPRNQVESPLPEEPCPLNQEESPLPEVTRPLGEEISPLSPLPDKPHLVMSNSLLDRTCPYFKTQGTHKASRVRFFSSTDSEDDEEISESFVNDESPRIDSDVHTIQNNGDAKLRTSNDWTKVNRRTSRKKEHQSDWNVVVRMDWRENTVDKRTIYSEVSDGLLTLLDDEARMLPPLDCSPRMTANAPDSQDMLEKLMVLKHNLAFGQKAHYKKDRVILPTVYTDFFNCPERKKKYINTMWSEYYKSKVNKRPECSKYTKQRSSCTFCEVMGSKYCSFCREFKNRHFALSYEEHYLPNITGAQPGRGLRRKLMEPQLQPRLPIDSQTGTKHPKKTPNSGRLLMPITYIPQERDKI